MTGNAFILSLCVLVKSSQWLWIEGYLMSSLLFTKFYIWKDLLCGKIFILTVKKKSNMQEAKKCSSQDPDIYTHTHTHTHTHRVEGLKPLLLPTDARNVKKRRVIKTF